MSTSEEQKSEDDAAPTAGRPQDGRPPGWQKMLKRYGPIVAVVALVAGAVVVFGGGGGDDGDDGGSTAGGSAARSRPRRS